MNTQLNFLVTFILLVAIIAPSSSRAQQKTPKKAVYISDVSWTAAREIFTREAVVVIPLGAGSKEHGPHLPLGSDQFQAEYFASEVAKKSEVLIAPIINYSYYPPFLQYAGSTSVSFYPARDMILDIVRSLAGYGPKRFYILNEGITTLSILQSAQKILREEGILLHYTDYGRSPYEKLSKSLRQESFGGHASELETSNVWVVRPDLVDMNKAVNDTTAKNRHGYSLTPVEDPDATLSVSGVVGSAKMGTKEKGRLNIAGTVDIIVHEIDSLKKLVPPEPEDRTDLFKSFSGTYQSEEGKHLELSLKNKNLEYQFDNRTYGRFYPLYINGRDELSGQHVTIRFIRTKDLITEAYVSFMGSFYRMKKIN